MIKVIAHFNSNDKELIKSESEIKKTNLDDFQSTTASAMMTPTPKPTSIPSKTTPSQAANQTTFNRKNKIIISTTTIFTRLTITT